MTPKIIKDIAAKRATVLQITAKDLAYDAQWFMDEYDKWKDGAGKTANACLSQARLAQQRASSTYAEARKILFALIECD